MTATDGHSALSLAKLHSFDILITDFDMPDMNGVNLFRQVKEIQPAIEGILMTGDLTEMRR